MTRPQATPSKHTPDSAGAGWYATPREDDPYLDTAALQQQINARNHRFGGLRIHVGAFRCPWPITRAGYEEYRKKAMDAWLHVMELKGWTLRSKLHIGGPFLTYDTSGDWYTVPLFDQREFRAKGAFSIDAKPQRLELPVHVLKGA